MDLIYSLQNGVPYGAPSMIKVDLKGNTKGSKIKLNEIIPTLSITIHTRNTIEYKAGMTKYVLARF